MARSLPSDDGKTGFMVACENGYTTIAEILLEHSGTKRIDFNAKDNLGRTAFMYACLKGRKEVVELILKLF